MHVDSPSEYASKLVKQVFEETQFRSWDKKLEEFPHAVELLEATSEVQRHALHRLIDHFEGVRTTYQGRLSETLTELIERMLKRRLPLSESDLTRAIQTLQHEDWCQSPLVSAAERFAKEAELGPDIRETIAGMREPIRNGWRSSVQTQKLLRRLGLLLGAEDTWFHVDDDEKWVQVMLRDLSQLDRDLTRLVSHAATASGGKPGVKWSNEMASRAASLEEGLLPASLKVWIAAFELPNDKAAEREAEDAYQPWSLWGVSEPNADLMKGLIWTATRCADDELVRIIGRAGISGQKRVPQVGPRSIKVTNAAIWALSQIDSQAAIGQLAILRSKVTNKSVQKQIDKAIDAVAERIGAPADEIEEMAVPAYGLTEVGRRTEQLGDFTAELIVTGTTSTEIRWLKPDGKPQKSVPKAVKENHADELKELKAAAKDIQKMLPAQRDRIDLLHLKQKTWAYATWRDRYLDHPLVGTLARRLIWVFDQGDAAVKVAAAWLDGQLVDAGGAPVDINADSATVSLWHPIDHTEADLLAWRRFFEDREIRQPFKQAHREIYLLTDAERNTRTYSNRYASHVIKQHQYNALCGIRGWTNKLRLCVDDEYPPTFFSLPEWGLRAEFWVEGVGDEYGVDTNDSGVYLRLATDQVRFYSIDSEQVSAHAGGGGYNWGHWRNGEEPTPLPLEDVPPLVFSEVMRDVDLFVGVASVGNDPTWQDGGPEGRFRDYWHDTSFGDLSATAQTRREILERLVPKLKIGDRCSFSDKFLVVRGDRRTYKIHLGSSNILMEPNDQYLCIVPGRGAGAGDKVFLPFEGDQRLAVILSKAMMLADDTKIKDPTILSQIGR